MKWNEKFSKNQKSKNQINPLFNFFNPFHNQSIIDGKH